MGSDSQGAVESKTKKKREKTGKKAWGSYCSLFRGPRILRNQEGRENFPLGLY